ncbi:MAG: phosphoadenylyl-sulfate reductase [Candidatus Dormibacteria bacterium]
MTTPVALERAADLSAVAGALEDAHPREAVAWALDRFPRDRVAVVTGLQADGVAVADMAIAIDPRVRIITIDTGRLPAESYEYLDTLRRHYQRGIEVIFPERADIERFTGRYGVNPFYTSAERRLECCSLRKVAPLKSLLGTLDCWLTGLRRDQSTGRGVIGIVERDGEHGGITKVNPLAAWGETDTLDHLASAGVPVHPLYGQGYGSIGCAPCTRATREGEDPRAGRWWWEKGIDKECGIHLGGSAASEVGSGHD